MRYCPTCRLVMVRDTSSGSMVFRCGCGHEEAGNAEDARISGEILGSSETIELYRRLIQSAPFDRTNQLVKRECTQCGLDYQTQVRVGTAEIIIFRCKCGWEEIPSLAATRAPPT